MTLTFELIQHKPFNFDLDYNSGKQLICSIIGNSIDIKHKLYKSV